MDILQMHGISLIVKCMSPSLQYSCLENPMDGWRSLVGYSPWGHKELDRTETLFFWAPKSLQMVTSATKLKDAYSLEGKL